jgi:hypothetical protein
MRRGTRLLTIVVLLATPFLRLHCEGAEPQPDASLTAADIFDRVVQANALRAAALESYRSTRQYAVLEPGHEADAELKVAVQFVSPSTKIFKTVSANGVGWIHKRVFQGLMQAEQETVGGKQQHDSAISPANYDAQLVGTDQYDGRDAYVLALTPKRRDKYLFIGRVWIDRQDFAIAKIEGEPAKSPSFWVVRAPFVREYQRINTFWLPLRDETHSQIRFVGEYILRVEYGDYQITPRT